MRVIKQGRLPETIEYAQTCMRCNTVFAFTKKDLKSDFRDGDYVACPTCGQYITPNYDKPIGDGNG